MPQVHNKLQSFDAASAFGKNSLYMASLRFTDKSVHQVKVLNKVENRIKRKKLEFYERERNLSNWKHDRMRNRLVSNLQKRIAYKFVLKNHNITNAKDYKKALDQKYTLFALHNEVNKTVDFLRPERVRERNAKAKVLESKNFFDNVVFNNTQKFNKLFPEKKTWLPRIRGAIPEPEVVKEPEPTPLPTRERKAKKSLALLRRRVISLDDSKPNSPVKDLKSLNTLSPLATPSLQPPSSTSPLVPTLRRQEISMSMMKKQKSFLEGKEKSGYINETHDNVVKEMETEMRRMSVEDTGNNDKENVKDSGNEEVTINIETESDGNEVNDNSKVEPVKGNTARSKRKNSLLPPIEPNKQPPDNEKVETKTKRSDSIKLPALKLSKKGQL